MSGLPASAIKVSAFTVSVVVVSWGRSDALARCLLGLSQVQYAPFEIVVVADPDGIKAAEAIPFAKHLKLLPFDEANISAARNLGLSHAAGEIIAFIDDDAVPEPQWLLHLVAPAERANVAAMGGFVRGRNGISFQWRARSLDALGEAHDLDVDAQHATVLTPPAGRAVKTEGTNMAFRRSALIDIGGFDPAFHYFLDEADLNMRLAQAGHATAIVPLAEVHHGFAANALRTQSRVPRDLFDIGASWAVFQRKHIPQSEHASQWKRLRVSERKRLLRHLVGGGLEPRDVRRLMGRLDDGYVEGTTRACGQMRLPTHPVTAFELFPSRARGSTLMSTRPWHMRKDLAEAAERVKVGAIVTLLDLSPTALFHHVKFTRDGVWLQRGGLFGKSNRDAPLFRLTTHAHRTEKERARVARQRGLH
jgi:glycosyltransferase involved in cell wall biosynthesis